MSNLKRTTSRNTPTPPKKQSPQEIETTREQHSTYESFSDLVNNNTPSHSSHTPRSRLLNTSTSSYISSHSSFNNQQQNKLKSGVLDQQQQQQQSDDDEEEEEEVEVDEQKELTTYELICLTIGLAGAQLTWTVEMAFGTPYLLSLGLTKQSTSLVWLAGPISGLLVQPVIGALSDSSTSRYRRRFFIALSAILVIISTLIVAYARAISSLLLSLGGLGDWDPNQDENIRSLAVIIAVGAFYFLDFSLNGLQASLRALILDRSPSSQQSVANAWHGRMTHLANIFGYLAGYINLGEWKEISWVGGGQFRKLAVLSCSVMVICVSITCWTQDERVTKGRDEENGGEVEEEKGIQWKDILRNIRDAIRNLPLPVRRVCYVQFFAWTAYFPFLFYSTTWVAEVYIASVPAGTKPPTSDTATRAGSLALLIFAIVAFTSGSILPYLSTIGRRSFIRNLDSSTRKTYLIKRTLSYLTPRNFWTFALAMYASLMICTFFVSTVTGAMWVIAALGVPWAVNCWVPFALVMESIRELETQPQPSTKAYYESITPPDSPSPYSKSSTTTESTPNLSQPFRANLRTTSLSRGRASESITECSPLITPERRSLVRQNSTPRSPGGTLLPLRRAASGGTILGIHNLAIVTPQFFVAIVAAGIFYLLDSNKVGLTTLLFSLASGGGENGSLPGDGTEGGLKGSNDVVWVLRFGGLAAGLGSIASRWVLKTRSELVYVEMLRKDEYLEEEESSEESL